jgi:hypothetical protein
VPRADDDPLGIAEEDPPPAAAAEASRLRAALPWSFKDLEGVMLGVSRPLIAWGGEIYKWAARDLDGLDGLDEEVTEAKANDDAAGIAADIRGIEEGAERPSVWSYPTRLASGTAGLVGTAVGEIGAWVASAREKARAAAAAAAAPPPLLVTHLTDAARAVGASTRPLLSSTLPFLSLNPPIPHNASHRNCSRQAGKWTSVRPLRAELELGCDEIHFLPVPDSGWSIALLRQGGHLRTRTRLKLALLLFLLLHSSV